MIFCLCTKPEKKNKTILLKQLFHTTKPFLKKKMSNAAELAMAFTVLRLERRNADAAKLMTSDVEWITPSMTGPTTTKGRDNVLAFWEKQDKDLPKVLDISRFTIEGEKPGCTSRLMTIEKKIMFKTMKLKLKQTKTFNADGMLVKSETKRQ